MLVVHVQGRKCICVTPTGREVAMFEPAIKSDHTLDIDEGARRHQE